MTRNSRINIAYNVTVIVGRRRSDSRLPPVGKPILRNSARALLVEHRAQV